MKSMKTILVAAFPNASKLRLRKPAVAAKAAKDKHNKTLHFDFVSETLREHSLVLKTQLRGTTRASTRARTTNKHKNRARVDARAKTTKTNRARVDAHAKTKHRIRRSDPPENQRPAHLGPRVLALVAPGLWIGRCSARFRSCRRAAATK